MLTKMAQVCSDSFVIQTFKQEARREITPTEFGHDLPASTAWNYGNLCILLLKLNPT
jgi:hypothetical protein